MIKIVIKIKKIIIIFKNLLLSYLKYLFKVNLFIKNYLAFNCILYQIYYFLEGKI